ncbi:MAG: ATP-dependent DNA ligase [Candidatus Micrarchaeia archaeon]
MRFLECAEAFNLLEKTPSRLEMTSILSELFKKVSKDEIQPLIYILQGIIAPPYEGIDMGFGEKFALDAIASASGHLKKEVEFQFKKLGDLGLVGEFFLSKKKQLFLSQKDLTIESLYFSFLKIAKTSGKGSQELKKKYLIETLNNASALESRFIIRFVLGELRFGVGDPTILDALSYVGAGNKSLREEIERAYNICSDLGHVAKIFFQEPEKLKTFIVQPLKPLIPALAERLSDPKAIIEKIGKCAVEYKFDGLRLQCHKKGEEVQLYSRKLEKITHMFPDIVSDIKSLKTKEIIFEGEALAYNSKLKKYYSFQETMHRRRKHGIEQMSKDFPMVIFVFDVLYADGRDLTQKPYLFRRKALEKIFPFKNLKQSEKFIVKTEKELQKIFQDATGQNLEGIMAKDLNSPYTAGKRKFAWIKLKKSYGHSVDTIDCTIIGYYLGKGSRTKFGFGGLLCAVYNSDTSKFETIANVGSGFSESDMEDLQKILDKIKISSPPRDLIFKTEPDFWVKPNYVAEIAFDEITLSPMHTCGLYDGKGYALRFPRFIRLREDKSFKECTTTKEAIDMHWLKNKK